MNSVARHEKQRKQIVGQLGPNPKEKGPSAGNGNLDGYGETARKPGRRRVSRIICENWWFV